jgi:hypothetical protein
VLFDIIRAIMSNNAPITAKVSAEMSLDLPSDRTRIADRKGYARSRVSNNRDILPDVDGRSLVARRYRDISSAILSDQGGADNCSESRLQLIRRFSAAAVLAEQMESRLANGETVNISEHALLCSTLVRIGHRIGLDRIPREVSDPAIDLYRRELERDDDDDEEA